jgi:hypothetical protein
MRQTLKKPARPLNKIQNLRPGYNPERELRAKRAVRHSKVNRFGGFAASAKPANKDGGKPIHGEVLSRPAKGAKNSVSSAAVLPSMVTSASHQKLERMLDEALTRADAHKQALKYQAARHFWQKPGFFSKRRWLKLSVLALIVLGASLFVAWQKVPQLSLKLAGMRAHVDALMPDYKPAGYAVSGPAKAINNTVAIQYASAEDKSKIYTVQEQPSNQTSTSLIADSSPADQPVQTAEANGIPIIIIKNKVKCVSNGIETTVTNKANLSPDELLNIAKSICA